MGRYNRKGLAERTVLYIQDSNLLLSATDLANHLACKHLTELNRLAAEGELKKPFRSDPILETLIERGNQHEQAYVDSLLSLIHI